MCKRVDAQNAFELEFNEPHNLKKSRLKSWFLPTQIRDLGK